MESEIIHDRKNEIYDLHNLVFDLIDAAENMGVILSESANTQKSMKNTCFFLAIHRTQLEIFNRKISIRPDLGLINQNMSRTIHRLDSIVFIIDFKIIHIFFVMA